MLQKTDYEDSEIQYELASPLGDPYEVEAWMSLMLRAHDQKVVHQRALHTELMNHSAKIENVQVETLDPSLLSARRWLHMVPSNRKMGIFSFTFGGVPGRLSLTREIWNRGKKGVNENSGMNLGQGDEIISLEIGGCQTPAELAELMAQK